MKEILFMCSIFLLLVLITMDYIFWAVVVGLFGIACFGCGYEKRCDDERNRKLRGD